ncbi:MAG TPA: hypothetical protein VMG12_23540 [Polyangiaceae bacterium]|nr:hypothetical protein [Polyangiaceae bacterium]
MTGAEPPFVLVGAADEREGADGWAAEAWVAEAGVAEAAIAEAGVGAAVGVGFGAVAAAR